jgi:hypothetical protein
MSKPTTATTIIPVNTRRRRDLGAGPSPLPESDCVGFETGTFAPPEFAKHILPRRTASPILLRLRCRMRRPIDWTHAALVHLDDLGDGRLREELAVAVAEEDVASRVLVGGERFV